MLVNKIKYQSIWLDDQNPSIVKIIDQSLLPFEFRIRDLKSVDDVFDAISRMLVRGAPLIGATAGFGIYLASLEAISFNYSKDHILKASEYLKTSRPTAVNLSWAVDEVLSRLDFNKTMPEISSAALRASIDICELEKENCLKIGNNGLHLLKDIAKKKKGRPVNILTHCNAGWLACIDYGTATAPVYLAKEKGMDLHVWVDETRPRNQGSKLTAWELGQNGIPYTLIADNTGGHLMQHGMVDIVLVGCDRATSTGDVANKIGTYLKALAAFDNNVPFYAVLPSTSIDFKISDGLKEIMVEERDPSEVTMVTGWADNGFKSVRICPEDASAVNYGFDITPSRLITGFVTEKGICKATHESIKKLFPEKYVN
jgi:methylthioribose-1-phosphate isomerase